MQIKDSNSVAVSKVFFLFYSLFKMLSLGHKLKMLKTCQNPFYKNIRVLCKNPLKKAKYSRNETILQRL